MKELWAPWRIEYFKKVKGKGCFLCEGVASSRDRAHLILTRGKTCVVLMNRYPYTGGHLMVAPFRHVATMEDLKPREMLELMQLTQQAIRALKRKIKPDGFNLGVNIGEAAGAGLKDHIHLHIVPRWIGDTNFVTVMADIRVLPQALQELWEELRKAMKS
jgi:ATP adenylyltransferase